MPNPLRDEEMRAIWRDMAQTQKELIKAFDAITACIQLLAANVDGLLSEREKIDAPA